MGRLLELSGHEKRTFHLGPEALIGRDPSCSIILQDPLVSRSHAELKRLPDGRYLLTDLASTHGTFVRDERISGCVLTDQQEFVVGDTHLRFVADPPSAAHREEPVPSNPLPTLIREEVFGAPTVVTDTTMLRTFKRWRQAFALFGELTAQPSLDSTYSYATQALKIIFDVDRAVVLLKDPHSGEFVPSRPDADGDAYDAAISQSIVQEALSRHSGIAVNNADQDLHFGQQLSVVISDIRAALAAPMVISGEVVGLLFLDSKHVGDAFNPADTELLTGIAAVLALVVKARRVDPA